MVTASVTSILSTLITANHILHYHSILDAYGHISVRNPQNSSTFFLARTLAPALVSSANDIVELNIADASPVDPNSPGSFVERFIHSEVLKRFDDVNSVLPYTITGVPFKAMYHMAGFLGHEGAPNFYIAEFYKPGDSQDLLVRNTELGASLASTFTHNSSISNPSFPDPPAVLMRRHGFTVAAETVEQAVFFAYYSQSNAEAQTGGVTPERAFSEGGGAGVHYLGAQEGKDSWAANRPLISRPWELWHREVQSMGNGLYVNELER